MESSEQAQRKATWLVIPAMNEEAVIAGVVAEVKQAGYSVVLVDDGSRDNTAAYAKAAGAVVIKHPINLGQGAALQTGIDYACRKGAEYIVTYDADGQMRCEDIPALIKALQNADIALGSRFLGAAIEGATKSRLALLKGAVMMSNRLSGLNLTDAHCGFRAFRATIAPKIRMHQDRMAHASELLRKIKTSGVRVVEVPVTIRYTEHSMAKGQHGIQAIRILFDYFFRAS
jgi:glycosyltransferase involved in cell wall biosynthesis